MFGCFGCFINALSPDRCCRHPAVRLYFQRGGDASLLRDDTAAAARAIAIAFERNHSTQQFVTLTGSTKAVAKRYLSRCDWNHEAGASCLVAVGTKLHTHL